MSEEPQNEQQGGAAEDEALLMAWDEIAAPARPDSDGDHDQQQEEEGPGEEDPWTAVAEATGRAGDISEQEAARQQSVIEKARQRRRERWDELRAQRQAAKQKNEAASAGGSGSNDEAGQGTPLAPYRDPRVQQKLEDGSDGVPEWLGLRWREIPTEQQQQAWIGLRKWVDWLVREYRLPAHVVPACWYRHPDITAELWAAMNMEHKAWAEGAPSLTPMMMWHPNLEQMIVRLRNKVETAGCSPEKGHQPPIAPGKGLEPFEIAYDEDDWQAATSGRRETQEVARPAAGSQWVRAVAFDGFGEQIAASNPVGLGASRANRRPEAFARFGSLAEAGEAQLWLDVERGGQVSTVQWETSTDGESWQPIPDNETGEDPAESADKDEVETPVR